MHKFLDSYHNKAKFVAFLARPPPTTLALICISMMQNSLVHGFCSKMKISQKFFRLRKRKLIRRYPQNRAQGRAGGTGQSTAKGLRARGKCTTLRRKGGTKEFLTHKRIPERSFCYILEFRTRSLRSGGPVQDILVFRFKRPCFWPPAPPPPPPTGTRSSTKRNI